MSVMQSLPDIGGDHYAPHYQQGVQMMYVPEKQMIFRFVPTFSAESAPNSILDFGTFRLVLEESEKSRVGGVTAEGAMMD